MRQRGKQLVPLETIPVDDGLDGLRFADHISTRINGIHAIGKMHVVGLPPVLQRFIPQTIGEYMADKLFQWIVLRPWSAVPYGKSMVNVPDEEIRRDHLRIIDLSTRKELWGVPSLPYGICPCFPSRQDGELFQTFECVDVRS